MPRIKYHQPMDKLNENKDSQNLTVRKKNGKKRDVEVMAQRCIRLPMNVCLGMRFICYIHTHSHIEIWRVYLFHSKLIFSLFTKRKQLFIYPCSNENRVESTVHTPYTYIYILIPKIKKKNTHASIEQQTRNQQVRRCMEKVHAKQNECFTLDIFSIWFGDLVRDQQFYYYSFHSKNVNE